jgi:hypothetical protein
MSKRLLTIIEEFQLLIKSAPPYADYYKGDIVKWLDKKLVKESIEDKRLLRTNFYNISYNYINENKNTITENVLNAQRVIDYITEKPTFLKLKQQYDASQILMLFRILHKDLNVFENTTEDVVEVLYQLFDFGKDNIKSYIQREKIGKIRNKTNKLFKFDWDELI